MILLDTDHLTVLGFPEDSWLAPLARRMRASEEQAFAATVISVEEQARGWLAEISRWRDVHKQIAAYDRLATRFRFYRKWEIVPLMPGPLYRRPGDAARLR